MRARLLLAILVCATCGGSACRSPDAGVPPSAARPVSDADRLRAALAARCRPEAPAGLRARCEGVARLYGPEPQPLWWTAAGPTRQARALASVLRRADGRGLVPAHYAGGVRAAAPARPPVDPAVWAPRDVALSLVAMRFVSDLAVGRVAPEEAGVALVPEAEAHDPVAHVRALASAEDVEAVVTAIEPPFAAYHRLAEALARYRGLARAAAPLPDLPATPVEPGEPLAAAPALRHHLALTGDHGSRAGAAPATGPAGAAVYDAPLAAAVARFQRRHGLTPDGVLGPDTAAALRVPIAERVRQIELAMERFRWLPHRFPAPPVAVNIPEFRLFAVRRAGGRYVRSDELDMRVIVGEAWERQTPVFESEIRSLVFWPTWGVPARIAEEEMLPEILRDPAYLERERLELVPSYDAEAVPPTPGNLERLAAGALRLRQRPGPGNALGLVKFRLPNRYQVYLHGTPTPWLFARDRRDLSHGCIRVEDPLALALHVLRDEPGWTRERIEAALAGPETRTVPLTRPVPVYVLYVTAVPRPGGAVAFFPDLYGLDARLSALLDALPRDA